jgi:hypothetical protein
LGVVRDDTRVRAIGICDCQLAGEREPIWQIGIGDERDSTVPGIPLGRADVVLEVVSPLGNCRFGRDGNALPSRTVPLHRVFEAVEAPVRVEVVQVEADENAAVAGEELGAAGLRQRYTTEIAAVGADRMQERSRGEPAEDEDPRRVLS